MKQKKPLFYFILLTLLIVAAIPYAIQIIAHQSTHFSVLTEMRNSYIENLSTSTNFFINATLKSYIEEVRMAAKNFSSYNTAGEKATPDNHPFTINHLLQDRQAFLGFAVLSNDGAIIAKEPHDSKIFDDLNVSKRFIKYSHKLSILQSTEGFCLPIIAPIEDSNNYLLGILNIKILDPFFQDISLPDSAVLRIVTRSGIIAESNISAERGTFISDAKIIDKIYSQKDGLWEQKNSKEATSTVAYFQSANIENIATNFMIISSQNYHKAFSLLSILTISESLPILIIIILVAFGTKLLYRYINEPLNSITKMITYIHNGIFDYQLKLNRSGELGTLLISFNNMAKNLERRFQYQKRMRQEILLHTRYEEKLKSSRAEAVSISKAKDEFLANISHEIRTPLNAIIGFSEKILMEHPDEGFSKNIQTILAESNHLLLLLNDLLDNAKIEADKLDLEYIPFDLHKCLHDTTDSFQEAARKKQLSFTLEISEDTPKYVIFDPLRFKQVLVNLLSNAIKFTERGSVTVRTAVTSTSNEHTDVYFSVVDTGIGIPKEKQESIFNEFSQADGSTTRKYGGTGLGTTIAKKLVTLMGGQMCLESEVGKGSTFWFTLSLNTNISESDLINISRENNSSLSNNANKFTGTILVAEDYEVNQELIRSQLQYLGLNVLIAKNGRIALEDCKRIFFDLIFMDLQMPEMGGIEAARRIRIDFPHYEKIPIIALTANADKDIRNVCKAVGMNGILNKPTHMDELAASLQKWLPKSCKTAPISVTPRAEKNAEKASITTENDTVYAASAIEPAANERYDPNLPINLDEAYTLFGNNKIVFNMAIDNFITSAENNLLPAIEKAFKENDVENLRKTAHKLKGGAASLTANKLSQLAGALEKSAECADKTTVPGTIKEIKKSFAHVKKYFQTSRKD